MYLFIPLIVSYIISVSIYLLKEDTVMRIYKTVFIPTVLYGT